MPPSLFVVSGRDQGAKFELEEGMMGLGRDSSNFVQVHDTEVSRRHAEIRREGEAYTVVDLGSSNGTYVNGERVTRHVLTSGDRLQVGSTLILFTDPGDAAQDDLSGKIDIVLRGNVSDNSRIVRSMSQEEGSAIFNVPLSPPRGARLDHARSNLQIMYRTTLAVSHTQDIDQLLTRIMQLIFDWVEADRGCVMLVNEETKQLEPKVHHHRQGTATDEKLVISRTILDYVAQRGEGVLTSDARDDDRWTPAVSILKMGVREAICVPMLRMVGVIYIDTSLTPQKIVQQGVSQKFTDEHLKLMIAIAHQAALAVGGHALSPGDGAGGAAGSGRPNDRHAFASHQEHPARNPRRQLLDRNGLVRPRRGRGPQGLGDGRAEPEQNLGAGDGYAHILEGTGA